ncbi:Uncharacterised protein [Klebsiella pneumoniae subsp. pneumoniae]|nr:Uncharacterised protein [Klebsiella pneumoniae subsp. pneumoniae]
MLQQYSQRLLIATVKAAAVRIGLSSAAAADGAFLNSHHLISTGVMVRAENQLSIREISSTWNSDLQYSPVESWGEANRREGEDGDDRRAKQRQRRATEHIVNRAQQRRALADGR